MSQKVENDHLQLIVLFEERSYLKLQNGRLCCLECHHFLILFINILPDTIYLSLLFSRVSVSEVEEPALYLTISSSREVFQVHIKVITILLHEHQKYTLLLLWPSLLFDLLLAHNREVGGLLQCVRYVRYCSKSSYHNITIHI